MLRYLNFQVGQKTPKTSTMLFERFFPCKMWDYSIFRITWYSNFMTLIWPETNMQGATFEECWPTEPRIAIWCLTNYSNDTNCCCDIASFFCFLSCSQGLHGLTFPLLLTVSKTWSQPQGACSSSNQDDEQMWFSEERPSHRPWQWARGHFYLPSGGDFKKEVAFWSSLQIFLLSIDFTWTEESFFR